jgi:hypothetical protein
MVAVVDAEIEKKVSKFEEYKVVADVEVRSSQASVKANWLRRLIGEALGSRSVGESRFVYCHEHLP